MASDTAVTTNLEVEVKLDVPRDFQLPDLGSIAGVAELREQGPFELDATYLDTARQDLARARITLRRRTGGKDAGWHLKLPDTGSGRPELSVPLGESDDLAPGVAAAVPVGLLDQVRAHVRDREVRPIVRLVTERTTTELVDADGAVLVEVAVDRVEATGFIADVPHQVWAECEAELVEGDLAALEAVTQALVAAGATPASGPSKLVRALGPTAPVPFTVPSPGPDASTGEVLLAAIAKHVQRLKSEDGRVRVDAEDSIHQLRVATRKLRTLLSTGRPLYDGAAKTLEGELKSLARVLGRARDLEVWRDQVDQALADDPTAADAPVRDATRALLQQRYRGAWQEAVAVASSQRYYRLLDGLDLLVADPPSTKKADRAAKQGLPDLLEGDWARLRSMVKRAREVVDPSAVQDSQSLAEQELHDVRKAAKRLRYAAEAMKDVLGEDCAALAQSAEELSDMLGEHHDDILVAEHLVDLATTLAAQGDVDVTPLLRLRASIMADAAAKVDDYRDAVDALSAKRLPGWKPIHA